MIVPPELDQSLFVDQHHDQDQLLVVLGNGFDLFHGFKSRYQDFWQHVGTTPLDEIVHFNRRARSQQVRWSDVEAQIRVAAENAYQLSATRKMPGAGVMVQQRSTRAIRRFEHEFSRYLRTERERVLVSDPTRSQTAREFLSQAGAVLNFNYTDTAQQLYDVWPENIYYLHGSLLEGQTILGVDNDDVLAREPYEYASTTKGYRRDILDFKRWAWQQNGWQPLTEKTLAAFRNYDAYYYGWRRLYPVFGDQDIISLLYTLDSDMPVTSRYFATRFFEQWQTRRQWLIDAIASRCAKKRIDPQVLAYTAANAFRPFKIKLPNDVYPEDIATIVVMGHSLRADHGILSDLFKTARQLKQVILFVFQGEPPEELAMQKQMLTWLLGEGSQVKILTLEY